MLVQQICQEYERKTEMFILLEEYYINIIGDSDEICSSSLACKSV